MLAKLWETRHEQDNAVPSAVGIAVSLLQLGTLLGFLLVAAVGPLVGGLDESPPALQSE